MRIRRDAMPAGLARPRTRLMTLALTVLVAGACLEQAWPSPAPVERDVLQREHEAWRAERREGLVSVPAGVLLWTGLHELREGRTAFGSDPRHPITLPAEHAPALAGVLRREGGDIWLEPAEGAPVRIRGGEPVTETILLGDDRSENRTDLALGSLGLRVHAEPGTDRLWLRVWDEDHPSIGSFELPGSYPVDPAWRVTARFDRFAEPRTLPVADVTGGQIEYEVPGELVFRHDGEEHRLLAVATPASTSYFIMMWDSTATIDTYQGGRYLRVPIADEDGWTTIDFNRTYNPPCVFTRYSVCGLPPRENRLPFHVTAGEKRPDAGSAAEERIAAGS